MVFLAFWWMQGPGSTRYLGGNGLELVLSWDECPVVGRSTTMGTRFQKSERFPALVFFSVTSSRAFRGSGPAPAEPSGLNSKMTSLFGS